MSLISNLSAILTRTFRTKPRRSRGCPCPCPLPPLPTPTPGNHHSLWARQRFREINFEYEVGGSPIKAGFKNGVLNCLTLHQAPSPRHRDGMAVFLYSRCVYCMRDRLIATNKAMRAWHRQRGTMNHSMAIDAHNRARRAYFKSLEAEGLTPLHSYDYYIGSLDHSFDDSSDTSP